jgi:hypothetical protein
MVTVMREDERRVFADYGENFTIIAGESCQFERREGFAALIHFLPRRTDVAPERFDEYIKTTYSREVAALKVCRSAACVFATNKVIFVPGPDYEFAAVSELWFHDVAQAQAAAHDTDHRKVMNELDTVCDASRKVSLLTRLNSQKKIGDGLPV